MSKNNAEFFKEKNEWSVIKDKLLGGYLKPYFQKLLMSGHPIYYVDCFAGKGRFQDGKDGSPLIALKIRDECLKASRIARRPSSIQTCFIEKTHGDELIKNIQLLFPTNNTYEVIKGKYEDNIEPCLADKKDYNVFLYVDPYGIKSLSTARLDRFKEFGFGTFEMLINFNSFGFFRNACKALKVNYRNDIEGLDELVEYEPTKFTASEQSQRMLTDIVGGEYWKPIIMRYNNGEIDGYQAELEISLGYKQYLNKLYKYVLNMPIRLKPGQRPKYRMMHVSNHEDGCFLMAQNMLKRKEELFINIQQGGQISLFDVSDTEFTSVEGDTVSIYEIENNVYSQITKLTRPIRLTSFIASFINTYGLICEFKIIYNALEKLEQSGIIRIERQPSHTPTRRISRFWEEDRDKTITIWRLK